MAHHLTNAEKRKVFPYLVNRDGYKCYLCGMEFKDTNYVVFEHIDSNDTNHDWDNLALAHQHCNVDKGKNLNKYINIIETKQEENRQRLYVGEKFHKKSKNQDISSEIEISHKCYVITEKYLTDKILHHGWVDYSNVLSSIVYVCKAKTGFGSMNQIRNHLSVLTSLEAPFEMTKDPRTKKKIIKKR
jgi:hypothetical protein